MDHLLGSGQCLMHHLRGTKCLCRFLDQVLWLSASRCVGSDALSSADKLLDFSARLEALPSIFAEKEVQEGLDAGV